MNFDCVGKYMVRTQPLPELPELEGQIVYIHDVSPQGVMLSLTDDCRPLDKRFMLPSHLNDAGWYDVSKLVLSANSAITARSDACAFCSEDAVKYRNYLGNQEVFSLMDEKSAIGHICLIGNIAENNVSFSKQGYFIVDVDDNGYVIAYAGFCQPSKEWETPEITQKILRFSGTRRRLFAAQPIVDACNAAYLEDIEIGRKYCTELRARVDTKEAADSDSFTRKSGGISLMNLRQ